mmetsp:Transcript_57892/g.64700  ORF Transcript_57892/g.64700 Transcript_57892/m.64700 type:complete len:276 (+) Transcript_57892:88-915(+)
MTIASTLSTGTKSAMAIALGLLLSTCNSGVAAFTTTTTNAIPTTTTTTALPVTPSTSPFANEIGAMAPFGFYDPLGLCAKNNNDPEYFAHLREVELRHGRVSMLAISGWLVCAAGVRLPGMEMMPNGFKAFSPDTLSTLPREVRGTLPLTVASIWFLTLIMAEVVPGTAEFEGDYRNGVIDFGWDRQTDEWKRSKRTTELANGRGAMMGILGIMVHEKLGNLASVGLPQPTAMTIATTKAAVKTTAAVVEKVAEVVDAVAPVATDAVAAVAAAAP